MKAYIVRCYVKLLRDPNIYGLRTKAIRRVSRQLRTQPWMHVQEARAIHKLKE